MKKVQKYPKNRKKKFRIFGENCVNSKPKHRKAKKWILSGADLVTLAGGGELVLYIILSGRVGMWIQSFTFLDVR